MSKSIINVRVDRETKLAAQEICLELGITLSSLVNAMLRHLVRTKALIFSLEGDDLHKAWEDIIHDAQSNKKEALHFPK